MKMLFSNEHGLSHLVCLCLCVYVDWEIEPSTVLRSICHLEFIVSPNDIGVLEHRLNRIWHSIFTNMIYCRLEHTDGLGYVHMRELMANNTPIGRTTEVNRIVYYPRIHAHFTCNSTFQHANLKWKLWTQTSSNLPTFFMWSTFWVELIQHQKALVKLLYSHLHGVQFYLRLM